MVDAQVACVGDSTVYRVLSDADLLSRWKRSAASSGEYNFRPTAPNQQWHTDVMYVCVAARPLAVIRFASLVTKSTSDPVTEGARDSDQVTSVAALAAPLFGIGSDFI